MTNGIFPQPIAGLIVSYAEFERPPFVERPGLIHSKRQYDSIVVGSLLGVRTSSADREWTKQLDLCVHIFRDVMFASPPFDNLRGDFRVRSGVDLWTIDPGNPYPFQQLYKNIVYLAHANKFYEKIHCIQRINVNLHKILLDSNESFNAIAWNLFDQLFSINDYFLLECSRSDCRCPDDKRTFMPSPLFSHCFSYRLTTGLLALAWNVSSIAGFCLLTIPFYVLTTPLRAAKDVVIVPAVKNSSKVTQFSIGIFAILSSLFTQKLADALKPFQLIDPNQASIILDVVIVYFKVCTILFALDYLVELKKITPKDIDTALVIHCFRQAPAARQRLKAYMECDLFRQDP